MAGGLVPLLSVEAIKDIAGTVSASLAQTVGASATSPALRSAAAIAAALSNR